VQYQGMSTHRWYIIDKRTNRIVSGPFTLFVDAAAARKRIGPAWRYGVFAGSYGEPGTMPEGYDRDLIRDMERGK
jgi:hypothetical protein